MKSTTSSYYKLDRKSNYRKATPTSRKWEKFRIPSKILSNQQQRKTHSHRKHRLKKQKNSRTTNISLESQTLDSENIAPKISQKFNSILKPNKTTKNSRLSLQDKNIKIEKFRKVIELEFDKNIKISKRKSNGSISVKTTQEKRPRKGSISNSTKLKQKVKKLISSEKSVKKKNSIHYLGMKTRLFNSITPKGNMNREDFFPNFSKNSEGNSRSRSVKLVMDRIEKSCIRKRFSRANRKNGEKIKSFEREKFQELSYTNNSLTERARIRKNIFQKNDDLGKKIKSPQTERLRSENTSICFRTKEKIWAKDIEKLIKDFNENEIVEDIDYVFALIEKIYKENIDLKQKLDNNYKATQNLMNAFFGFQKSLEDRCRQKQGDCEERVQLVQNLENKVDSLQTLNQELESEINLLKLEQENLVETVKQLEGDFFGTEKDERVEELEEIIKNQQIEFEEEKDYLQIEMV